MINLDSYKKIIFIHYGKVASNALSKSLRNTLQCKSRHIKSHKKYPEKILSTGLDYQFLRKLYPNDKFLFVTISRNLINQYLSAFFQIKGKSVLRKNMKYEDLLNKLANNLQHINFSRGDVFFRNITKNIGLGRQHVYLNFKKEQKYLFSKGPKNIDLLFLRFEDSKSWCSIFKTLFGIEMTLIKSNHSNDKSYADLYKYVKDNMKTHDSYPQIEKLYQMSAHYKYLYK